MSDTHLSQLRFADLNLPEPVLRGLDDAGFAHCTQIQAETLPHVLAGNDVAGQAKTGTGKTAAFLVAVFTHLIRDPAPAERRLTQPLALIVAPTRELAVQIHKDAELLGRHCGFRIGLVFGGTGYIEQRDYLTEGVDILIGTPGRLIDYFKQKVFDLQACEVAVLDEADRMFDLGFINDIRFLFRRMPPPDRRLSMLFSATLSLRVTELAYEHMNNPIHIRAGSDEDGVSADNVTESLYHPATNEKIPLLVGLLRKLQPTRSIIFVNTKRSAEAVNDYLEANGFGVGMLSGDVPQTKRLRLLTRFQTGDLPILIATDVAARGLHIADVSHVFNFDLPQQAEDYVHRIGRTARAGRSGAAVSFACEEFAFSLPEIEAYIGHKIEAQPIENDLLPPLERPPRRERKRTGTRDTRGRDGGRGPRRDDKGRPPRRRGEQKAPAAAETPKPVEAAGAGDADNKPRRRRRRRKPDTGAAGSTAGAGEG